MILHQVMMMISYHQGDITHVSCGMTPAMASDSRQSRDLAQINTPFFRASSVMHVNDIQHADTRMLFLQPSAMSHPQASADKYTWQQWRLGCWAAHTRLEASSSHTTRKILQAPRATKERAQRRHKRWTTHSQQILQH
jgi:hypothetical protein